ncbi:MAG TPA: pro-sigmaK processing inhibitor BofA [Clostridia bacterium]|jgi:inhibitor of the pro-sigma K processing machinery|nr:pro-sigmaK processing inhibitor BofA [Clostridia bacterium]
MAWDYRVIAAFIFGVLLLYLFAKILFVPLKIVGRLVFNGILGGVILWLVNLVGSFFDFSVPINPITALVAGFLGIPGVVLIIALKFLMV